MELVVPVNVLPANDIDANSLLYTTVNEEKQGHSRCSCFHCNHPNNKEKKKIKKILRRKKKLALSVEDFTLVDGEVRWLEEDDERVSSLGLGRGGA